MQPKPFEEDYYTEIKLSKILSRRDFYTGDRIWDLQNYGSVGMFVVPDGFLILTGRYPHSGHYLIYPQEQEVDSEEILLFKIKLINIF